MKRMMTVCSVALLATLGAFSPVFADGVRIGVNIGIPTPVVVAPAPVVFAPPVPVVFAPGVPIYFYGAQYYTFYNGGWFVGPRHGGPWRYVAVGHVPRAVIGAPHFHGRHGHGHGHGHGHRGHHR